MAHIRTGVGWASSFLISASKDAPDQALLLKAVQLCSTHVYYFIICIYIYILYILYIYYRYIYIYYRYILHYITFIVVLFAIENQ